MRFVQGLTIAERRAIREEILEKFLERARRQAAESRLTLRCRNAMYYTGRDPAKAREEHASCRGEAHGGVGCLCQCHDIVTGTVEAGQMEQIELPLLFEE